MPRRRKPLDTDDPLRDLSKAIRRLKPDQSEGTRKTARAAVLLELRRVRALVDQEYPAIRKPVKRRSPTTRAREARKRGDYGIARSTILWNCCIAAKIPVVISDRNDTYGYIPQWTRAAWMDRDLHTRHASLIAAMVPRFIEYLVHLRKNKTERDALEVRVGLSDVGEKMRSA